MTVRSLLTILCVLLGFAANAEKPKQDSLVVSLLTCNPGREIYELCGHEAIRIQGIADGQRIDSVWNYGVFDFNQPNFIYRFVKGETDYMLVGYPIKLFMLEYILGGREVTEQQLNISQPEAKKLLGMLREESKPENRQYRYNYVKDNCSTRIVDRIDDATQRRIIYPDNVNYGTFRKTMRHYHRNYPWYQFGIDLALGSGIDVPISGREEMFVPIEFRDKAAQAKYEDGTPFVRNTYILAPDSGNATDGPTPWYLTPIAVSIALLIIFSALCIIEVKKGLLFPLAYSIWYGVTGLAGCLVFFLVFFSTHEATSPNLLLVWLNPLQLLFAVTIWIKRWRTLNMGLSWYNIIGVGCLLIIWVFQSQSGNLAFFPMMAISVLLSIAYVMVAPFKIINNEKKNSILGTGKHGGNERRDSSRRNGSRGAKTGGRNRR